jgi:hypothetical protein
MRWHPENSTKFLQTSATVWQQSSTYLKNNFGGIAADEQEGLDAPVQVSSRAAITGDDDDFSAASLLTGAASVAQRMGLVHNQPPVSAASAAAAAEDRATAAAMAAVAGIHFRGGASPLV